MAQVTQETKLRAIFASFDPSRADRDTPATRLAWRIYEAAAHGLGVHVPALGCSEPEVLLLPEAATGGVLTALWRIVDLVEVQADAQGVDVFRGDPAVRFIVAAYETALAGIGTTPRLRARMLAAFYQQRCEAGQARAATRASPRFAPEIVEGAIDAVAQQLDLWDEQLADAAAAGRGEAALDNLRRCAGSLRDALYLLYLLRITRAERRRATEA